MPPVPVQLVEDPLPRLIFHAVAAVDERAGLVIADAHSRLGDQGIKLVLGSWAHREPHHECERLAS
jgi:hypothetical protein